MPRRTSTANQSGQARGTARLYLIPPDANGNSGVFFTVKVKDATRSVSINGTIDHVLGSYRGVTLGCHLSNVAWANASAFPHRCLMAPFFTKTVCYVVDKIRGGVPISAVRYNHSYGELVDMNDTGENLARVRRDPNWAEREFILRPPQKFIPNRPRSFSSGDQPTNPATRMAAVMSNGALRRALRAGLVNISAATGS